MINNSRNFSFLCFIKKARFGCTIVNLVLSLWEKWVLFAVKFAENRPQKWEQKSNLRNNPECQFVGQNRPKSWFQPKSQDFLRFESAKPLQTFSASTTLRVRCSVRCPGPHSGRNVGKTSKIEQIPLRNQLKRDTNAWTGRSCFAGPIAYADALDVLTAATYSQCRNDKRNVSPRLSLAPIIYDALFLSPEPPPIEISRRHGRTRLSELTAFCPNC